MSAVDEYRNNRWGMTCANSDGVGFGGYGDFVPKVLADAAITELEAELAEYKLAVKDHITWHRHGLGAERETP